MGLLFSCCKGSVEPRHKEERSSKQTTIWIRDVVEPTRTKSDVVEPTRTKNDWFMCKQNSQYILKQPEN